MKNFRVRCVRPPRNGDFVDSHVTSGKFYTVTEVSEHAGQEFFTLLGDLNMTVERPSQYFIRLRKGT